MVLICFLAGIALHSIFPWSRVPVIFWICTFILLAGTFSIVWRYARWRRYMICIGLFVFGVWRFDVTIPGPLDGLSPYVGEQILAEGQMDSQSAFGAGTSVIVTLSHIGPVPLHGPGDRIGVTLFGRSAPPVGSTVEIDCKILPVQETFDARRGIWFQCGNAARMSVRAPPSRWNVLAYLSGWHDALTSRIADVFPPDEATLLSGILYGDQDLSAAQRELMRKAGLMHIVAVSGSNVTIVVSVLLAATLAVGLRRRHAFWIVSLGILAFLGFVGFSSSVMRAGVMGWLVLLARHVGRIPSVSRLLLLSAAVLSCLNPWSLGFDAGFALSFLATWGLLAWTPIVNAATPWIPERFGVREAFATTSGATIMTLPYLGWMSGRMSLAGLFTNMLALPLIPFIMLWGAMSAAWGSMFGSSVYVVPTLGLLNLLERIAHLADLVPALDLHLTNMDFPLMITMYLLLWRIWCSFSQDTELSTSHISV